MLRLGRDHVLSSLSPEHMANVSDSGRFRDAWTDEQVKVKVITLESLISQFGMPDFIKIYVECFESQVLAGLISPVPTLSFEFMRESLNNTVACIERLRVVAKYRFQLSLGESLEFASSTWLDPDDTVRWLNRFDKAAWGEAF